MHHGKSKDRMRAGVRRSFSSIPNMLTLGGLFCGFLSIVYTLEKDFQSASLLIYGSLFFDLLDGQVARLSHSVSRFGKELDSLADMISFGVSPSLLIFTWLLQPVGRFGWLAAFLYVACAALRLARFNSRADPFTTRYFYGLPTPGAAGLIASFYLVTSTMTIPHTFISSSAPFIVFTLAILMVSTIHYPSPKELPFMKKNQFQVLVVAVFLLVAVAYKPRLMILFIGTLYLVSGPVYHVILIYRKKKKESESARHSKKDSAQLIKIENNSLHEGRGS